MINDKGDGNFSMGGQLSLIQSQGIPFYVSRRNKVLSKSVLNEIRDGLRTREFIIIMAKLFRLIYHNLLIISTINFGYWTNLLTRQLINKCHLIIKRGWQKLLELS